MRRRWRLLAVGVADGACAASHRLRQQPPHARSEEQHQPTYGECANLGDCGIVQSIQSLA